MPPASLFVNLLASCFITLLWWISSSIENLCELSTTIMPITMRVFFFFFSVAAAALMERLPLAASYVMVTVTMEAHASWTQRQMYLCVCEYFIILWTFYNMTLDVHGISALLFSILGVTYFKWMFHGHLWSSIVPHCSCTTELSPSLIYYWFHKEEIIHSLASYLFQRFRHLRTWKCL